MFNTILVPVDIAQLEGAAQAVALARDISSVRGGRITLLNVVEAVPSYIAAEIPVEVLNGAAQHSETELKGFAEREGLGTDAEIVVRRGHASRDILEFASERKVDMIVMASHDPGLVDYFLGSTATHVVRHAHCSVLVVRNVQA